MRPARIATSVAKARLSWRCSPSIVSVATLTASTLAARDAERPCRSAQGSHVRRERHLLPGGDVRRLDDDGARADAADPRVVQAAADGGRRRALVRERDRHIEPVTGGD